MPKTTMITSEQIKALGEQAAKAGQTDVSIVLLSLATTMELGTTKHLVAVVKPFINKMIDDATKFFWGKK